RNQVHRYNKNDESMQRYQRELDWVSSINNALEEGRFELYYQSLRPLRQANEGHYYEILLRLRETNGNIVEPANFLPTAERFEMNVKVDKWVITNTFTWLAENPEHLEQLKRCSINLNCHSLADRDFTLFVLNAFENYNIPYHKICFEVIESVAIIKMEDTLSFMRTFNRLGCTFALDDFGSGFSSYSYLKSLPVSQVKIDGMFIKDMLNDSVDTAMVASINDVAKAMGMQTVGEFVESDAIMIELGKIGIDFAQGFGVAKPAPLKDFTPL
ncbi:MAG: EAL domain-containing protein, partial [Pseudomonadota bacterium]|nr:EAL domain-containing protein [Pseudomonadota bacterium]